MKLKLFIAALVPVVVAAFIGCDTEPAGSDASLGITPSSAAIYKNQSVTFYASGGYSYKWTLTSGAYGILSASTGSVTTYTSLYDPGSSNSIVTETLTLTSTIIGSTDTNGAPYTTSTEAFIQHLSRGTNG